MVGLAGVSPSSIKQIAAEVPVHVDDAAERAKRQICVRPEKLALRIPVCAARRACLLDAGGGDQHAGDAVLVGGPGAYRGRSGTRRYAP